MGGGSGRYARRLQGAGVGNVKERGILFSGPMVRAILDGRKTQTRRPVKFQPPIESNKDAAWYDAKADLWRNAEQFARDCCPYGRVGDLLWAREAWWTYPGEITTKLLRDGADTWPRWQEGAIAYDADGDTDVWRNLNWIKRPSLFMPRYASRITLAIVGVRVERLQKMTEADAKAEGVPSRDAFIELWDSINAKRGFAWATNPWVWVIEFKRLA